jgi:hypothetical protein
MIRGFISNVVRPRASRDLELAKSNLVNHLYTRKRSRVMMPEFGFVVWDVFMDLIASDTRQIIQDDLVKIISFYPYFELLDLNISELTCEQITNLKNLRPHWEEGKVWVKVSDRKILYSLKGYNAWVEQAACILIDIVISYHYTQIVEFGVLLKS